MRNSTESSTGLPAAVSTFAGSFPALLPHDFAPCGMLRELMQRSVTSRNAPGVYEMLLDPHGTRSLSSLKRPEEK